MTIDSAECDQVGVAGGVDGIGIERMPSGTSGEGGSWAVRLPALQARGGQRIDTVQSDEVEISGVVLRQRAAEDGVGFAGAVRPPLGAGSIQGMNAARIGNVKSPILSDKWGSEREVKRI